MPLDGEQFSFLEKVINLVEKHGLVRIFKAIFVITAFFFVMYNGQNVSEIVENVIQKQETEHSAALEYRKKINPKIELQLSELLINTGANRAFVMEMHNGTSNVSGLPFYYGEMTYEKVTPNVVHIDEDYKNLNLSRFSFAYYLDEHNSWHGNLEDLAKIDNKLSMRMKSNDVSYIIIECIHGLDKPVGFLGVTYCDNRVPANLDNVIRRVNVESKKMSALLDMKRANLNN